MPHPLPVIVIGIGVLFSLACAVLIVRALVAVGEARADAITRRDA